ncbi:hypothetical protein [Parasutterella muris]|uniref:hypothetical protein n=1 Tax=Parasutterella muris TaxID=2565572 RepID=UPI002040EB14|nr:hypothetical protein [Parasutterella muris]
MAGYQRHDFDTINVAPQSDGPWGALARGISNGYQIGQAINKGINRYNVAKANDTYNEGMDNLKANQTAVPVDEEGLKKLDEKFGGKTLGEADAGFKGTQYENMTASEYFRQNHKRDFDKESTALAEARDRATKDSFLHYEGAEAYNNYLKSEAEGSKASFEKLFTDTKMNLTKQFQLWDSGTPEGNQDMFAAAQKQGLIPEGATFDPKNMTMTAPGEDGKPVVTQITPDMIGRTKDALQLNSLKGLYKLDPGQRKAISDMTVAENTEGARIETERLRPKLAKSADARGWEALKEQNRHNTTLENLTGVGQTLKGPEDKGFSDEMVNVEGVSLPASYLGGVVDKDGNVIDPKAFETAQKKYQRDTAFMGQMSKRLGINLSGITPNMFRQMILSYAQSK